MQTNGGPARPQVIKALDSNGDSENITASSTVIAESTSRMGPSPSMVLSTRSPWLPILESLNNQLVLYNPTSHALTITPSSLLPVHRMIYDRSIADAAGPSNTQIAPVVNRTRILDGSRTADSRDALLSAGEKICPWCSRPYPEESIDHSGQSQDHEYHSRYTRDGSSRRAPNYFKLLEQANYQAQSRPASPPLLPGIHSDSRIRIAEMESPIAPGTPERTRPTKLGLNTGFGTDGVDSPIPGTPKRRFGESSMAQGYFAAFFKEERRLGMGANGTVYLCQVRISHSLIVHRSYASH